MSQVIEVRLMHTVSGEQLHQAFTAASSHREAIELALFDWSGGAGVLKEIQQDEELSGKFVGTGAVTAWRYVYECVLEDPEDAEHGRMILAVLFASYKEKVTNA